jgi:hypothetical protein
MGESPWGAPILSPREEQCAKKLKVWNALFDWDCSRGSSAENREIGEEKEKKQGSLRKPSAILLDRDQIAFVQQVRSFQCH